MQLNGATLRALLEDEARAAGAEGDLAPAGDPAIRAHLRFVAAALAGTASEGSRARLEAFAAGLGERLAECGPALDAELQLVGDGAAFEASMQFGEGARDDPAMGPMLERRVRVQAWTRVFLAALDEGLGPGTADAANAWMAARQTQLADTIFAMDRRAKQAEIDRGGQDAVADPATVNRIGQAAMLQAHTRFLVEALAATMGVRRGGG
jgi:hypothetical protein